MSGVRWLWKASSVALHEIRRPQEVPPLIIGRFEVMNVLRIDALAGSICRVLRGSEVGCPSEEPQTSSWELREAGNDEKIVVPGASICCILRGSEAPGGSGRPEVTNVLWIVVPGGSVRL